MGFDDMNFAEMLNPPLTTIRQDAHVFGRQGVRSLLALLNNEPQEMLTRVPVALVERSSVASLRTKV